MNQVPEEALAPVLMILTGAAAAIGLAVVGEEEANLPSIMPPRLRHILCLNLPRQY